MLNDGLKNLSWRMEGGVGVLTLNRPDRLNALDIATVTELDRVVAHAAADPGVRCVVLTGAGRGFCAGADVQEWNDGPEPDEEPWPPRMHRVMARLYWLPKPVVAAVNGVAVGAGCDLTLVADVRIASTAARFGQAYIKLGYCPDAGGSYLLPKIVGESRAAEMIYTGRMIDAAEADRIGLVSTVVEPDQLMDTAMELANRFASGPTVAIGIAKQNIRKNRTVTFEEALRNEVRGGEICAHTEDHLEGMQATIEKRPAVYTGR
jgi:2-(1,2-epoxy-1,2-dihydrophenyl)acetyl-CoA isomerase